MTTLFRVVETLARLLYAGRDDAVRLVGPADVGVSQEAWLRAIAIGELTAVVIDGRRLARKMAVDAWLADQERAAARRLVRLPDGRCPVCRGEPPEPDTDVDLPMPEDDDDDETAPFGPGEGSS